MCVQCVCVGQVSVCAACLRVHRCLHISALFDNVSVLCSCLYSVCAGVFTVCMYLYSACIACAYIRMQSAVVRAAKSRSFG